MADRKGVNELRNWENGHREWDFAKETYNVNKELCDNFGQDPFTFDPELRMTSNHYWRSMEAPMSHGYPKTAWL